MCVGSRCTVYRNLVRLRCLDASRHIKLWRLQRTRESLKKLTIQKNTDKQTSDWPPSSCPFSSLPSSTSSAIYAQNAPLRRRLSPPLSINRRLTQFLVRCVLLRPPSSSRSKTRLHHQDLLVSPSYRQKSRTRRTMADGSPTLSEDSLFVGQTSRNQWGKNCVKINDQMPTDQFTIFKIYGF